MHAYIYRERGGERANPGLAPSPKEDLDPMGIGILDLNRVLGFGYVKSTKTNKGR